MAITSAVSDLVASVYELFASFLGAIYTIVHSFLAGIANLFAGVFHMFADVFQGVFDLVGGVGKFIAGKSSSFHASSTNQGKGADGVWFTGNAVIIGLVAAAGYAYVRFTAQGQVQGQRVGAPGAGAKKVN